MTVARALLGQRLVRVLDDGTRIAGNIVETEAYLGEPDKAAHTFNGRRTDRNASMWLGGGFAYVYFTYGMHFCMNVVASQPEHPVAVLLRAVEPTEGLEQMRRHRLTKRGKTDGVSTSSQMAANQLQMQSDAISIAKMPDTNLCSGPAKLCQAFGIDRKSDGIDLVTSERIFIEKVRNRTVPGRFIATTARVGVAYAEDWADKPLRFYLRGNPHVSRK